MQNQRIRIRLKAFDHRLIDQSAHHRLNGEKARVPRMPAPSARRDLTRMLGPMRPDFE